MHTDRFTPLDAATLLRWMQHDLPNKQLFGIDRELFFMPKPDDPFRMERYGKVLETPLGVAAGPHTQLAQNILSAWLCGARYIELKTVQVLDELNVAKPCIDMADEGYNCEWSQELKLDQSFEEYLKAFVLLYVLRDMLNLPVEAEPGKGPGFIFNMSAGYNLEAVSYTHLDVYKRQYHIPSVDVHVKAVFTNNLPAGAFRGFGVNQSNFAMECLIDELCEKGGFDRWQFRYDNAVAPGRMVTTGQVLGEGTALRETLLAVRDAFRSHPRAGIACAIKNSGIGNGIPEPCDCYLEVHPAPEQPAGARLVLHHGWTEMGQGINTVARQMLCEVAELGPDVAIDITASTEYGAFAGSTTASRGTFQLGHAVVNAARQLRGDLNKYGGRLDRLVGRFYKGHYDSAGQTSGQGAPGEIRNHVSYSFATHVVFMDEEGGIEKIIAAHDSGRVVNRPLYEGQVQGGVVMGMGYALTESIPVKGGYLTSGKLNACGLLRSVDVPEIEVIAVEVPDPEGPCGAKGIGEIACIPTAPAIVNALYLVDGGRRRELPVRKKR